MPVYTPPDFNLVADLWFFPNVPVIDPPDIVDIPCQLYRYSRDTVNSPIAYIRIPDTYSSVDWPNTAGIAANPIMEVVQGSERYYRVDRALWMHLGFPNQYIELQAVPIGNLASIGTTLDSDRDLTNWVP